MHKFSSHPQLYFGIYFLALSMKIIDTYLTRYFVFWCDGDKHNEPINNDGIIMMLTIWMFVCVFLGSPFKTKDIYWNIMPVSCRIKLIYRSQFVNQKFHIYTGTTHGRERTMHMDKHIIMSDRSDPAVCDKSREPNTDLVRMGRRDVLQNNIHDHHASKHISIHMNQNHCTGLEKRPSLTSKQRQPRIAQIAPLSFHSSHRTHTQTSEVRWLHASVVTEWSPACLHKQFLGDLHRGN